MQQVTGVNILDWIISIIAIIISFIESIGAELN